jgi:phytoene synthase
MKYPEYESDLAYCRSVHKEYGKSFYFGTALMSREYSDAICVLYAFFRLPDEYIDTQHKDEKELALQKLNKWKEDWNKCYRGEVVDALVDELKVLRASRYVFHKYQIPFEYSDAFLKAMIQDTYKSDYETYKELEDYMYGSASVVGLMLVYIVAEKDKIEPALEYAQALGEAFQMTNFLRDISEDVVQRDRVYLPQEDMEKFGVTKQDLIDKKITPNFVELMKFEIKRTRDLYEKADLGLQFLPKKEAKGIRVARVLYSKILDKIEDAEYDIFSKRLSLSFAQKFKLAVLTLIKNK